MRLVLDEYIYGYSIFIEHLKTGFHGFAKLRTVLRRLTDGIPGFIYYRRVRCRGESKARRRYVNYLLWVVC
jgi:hypothetical protein